VSASEDFLFPVHVLDARSSGASSSPASNACATAASSAMSAPIAARRRRARLYKQSWVVVFAKRPFFGVEQVYRHLGRYSDGVGISNRRLISIDDSAIVFPTRDGRTATRPPLQFIRRFLGRAKLLGGAVPCGELGAELLVSLSQSLQRTEIAGTLEFLSGRLSGRGILLLVHSSS
jgi:hypothetical protein